MKGEGGGLGGAWGGRFFENLEMGRKQVPREQEETEGGGKSGKEGGRECGPNPARLREVSAKGMVSSSQRKAKHGGLKNYTGAKKKLRGGTLVIVWTWVGTTVPKEGNKG